jgi:hypothetical protein
MKDQCMGKKKAAIFGGCLEDFIKPYLVITTFVNSVWFTPTSFTL